MGVFNEPLGINGDLNSFYSDVNEDGLALIYIDRYVDHWLDYDTPEFILLSKDTLYTKLPAPKHSKDCAL